MQQLLETYTSDIESLIKDAQVENGIDKYKLTDEIIDHSRRYLHWAALLSCAESRLRAYEDLLKEVEADCRRQIRDELSRCDEKVTEKRIDDSMVLMPLYKSTLRSTRRCEAVAEVLRAVEVAFRDRGRMLQSANSRDRDDLRVGGRQQTKPPVEEEHAPAQRSASAPKDWDEARELFIKRKIEDANG